MVHIKNPIPIPQSIVLRNPNRKPILLLLAVPPKIAPSFEPNFHLKSLKPASINSSSPYHQSLTVNIVEGSHNSMQHKFIGSYCPRYGTICQLCLLTY